jgi:uncharacterized protein
VKTSEFVVPLADLERGPKHVTWPITAQWLRLALEGTEAVPAAEPGELTVELSKSGREVMARGKLSASVTMPCARTLEPVPVEVATELFLLLAPAPSGEPQNRRPRRRRADKSPAKGPGGQPSPKAGPVKSAKPKGAGLDEDLVLTDQDAARDTYSGEEIVLDPFVREFILLELPMFPMQKGLPSDEPATIAGPSVEAPEERPVDPRLLPLVEIASRLRNKE